MSGMAISAGPTRIAAAATTPVPHLYMEGGMWRCCKDRYSRGAHLAYTERSTIQAAWTEYDELRALVKHRTALRHTFK